LRRLKHMCIALWETKVGNTTVGSIIKTILNGIAKVLLFLIAVIVIGLMLSAKEHEKEEE